MSWELTIRGGKTISVGYWQVHMMLLGVTLKPASDFELHVTADVTEFSFAVSSKQYRFAKESVLMQFETERFGPLDPKIDSAALASSLERRGRQLEALKAPAVVLEHEREKRASLARAIAGTPDEQRIYVSVPESYYVVQTFASAQYALAAGASIAPLDTGGEFSGPAIHTWVAARLQ